MSEERHEARMTEKLWNKSLYPHEAHSEPGTENLQGQWNIRAYAPEPLQRQKSKPPC